MQPVFYIPSFAPSWTELTETGSLQLQEHKKTGSFSLNWPILSWSQPPKDSCHFSARSHSPRKEGAKTLRFQLSITRPSLQLVFRLRCVYFLVSENITFVFCLNFFL